MNKEDIIRMYAKANGWSPAAFTDTLEELERFADLVASAEREACAKQLDALGCDHCATAIRAREQA